jgi:alpha/beta superfamily hydrolase
MSTILFHGLCHTFHQSHIDTTKDNAVALSSYPAPQFLGKMEEIGVDMGIGRTEYSYLHKRYVVEI